MIDRIRYIRTKKTEPYANLALEEYLLQTVRKDECIFYLWQNWHTVVVGRNQNCWKECKVHELEKNGGSLVRRLSGGGAVYHDLGNLNFTFLAHEDNYDLDRQIDVILRAVQKWGISAKKTGRNDITVNGSKFSGNAFYTSGGRKYHHGTILVNVEMESLSRYLNVSAEKMQSKGVSSVRSRVANLTEFNPNVTVEGMIQTLTEAFGEVYGLMPEEIAQNEINWEQIELLTKKFSSWDWKFGRQIEFTCEIAKRFAWGDIQIQLKVFEGRILEATAFSDAIDVDFVTRIPDALSGCEFSPMALSSAVGSIPADEDTTREMSLDIQTLLLNECC